MTVLYEQETALYSITVWFCFEQVWAAIFARYFMSVNQNFVVNWQDITVCRLSTNNPIQLNWTEFTECFKHILLKGVWKGEGRSNGYVYSFAVRSSISSYVPILTLMMFADAPCSRRRYMVHISKWGLCQMDRYWSQTDQRQRILSVSVTWYPKKKKKLIKNTNSFLFTLVLAVKPGAPSYLAMRIRKEIAKELVQGVFDPLDMTIKVKGV